MTGPYGSVDEDGNALEPIYRCSCGIELSRGERSCLKCRHLGRSVKKQIETTHKEMQRHIEVRVIKAHAKYMAERAVKKTVLAGVDYWKV